MMFDVGTIKFIDSESNDEGCIVVRYDDDMIGLSLSLKTNGDVEVFVRKDVAQQLIDALTIAMKGQ